MISINRLHESETNYIVVNVHFSLNFGTTYQKQVITFNLNLTVGT